MVDVFPIEHTLMKAEEFFNLNNPITKAEEFFISNNLNFEKLYKSIQLKQFNEVYEIIKLNRKDIIST